MRTNENLHCVKIDEVRQIHQHVDNIIFIVFHSYQAALLIIFHSINT